MRGRTGNAASPQNGCSQARRSSEVTALSLGGRRREGQRSEDQMKRRNREYIQETDLLPRVQELLGLFSRTGSFQMWVVVFSVRRRVSIKCFLSGFVSMTTINRPGTYHQSNRRSTTDWRCLCASDYPLAWHCCCFIYHPDDACHHTLCGWPHRDNNTVNIVASSRILFMHLAFRVKIPCFFFLSGGTRVKGYFFFFTVESVFFSLTR